MAKSATSVQAEPLKVSVAPLAGPEPATNPAAVVPAPPKKPCRPEFKSPDSVQEEPFHFSVFPD